MSSPTSQARGLCLCRHGNEDVGGKLARGMRWTSAPAGLFLRNTYAGLLATWTQPQHQPATSRRQRPSLIFAAMAQGSGECTATDVPRAEDYIQTASQCYVSRKATLHHAQSIELRGKSIVESGVNIHGISPAAAAAATAAGTSTTGRSRKVRIGRYCYIGPDVTLRPATMPSAHDDDENDESMKDEGDSGGKSNAETESDAARQEMSLILGANTSIGSGTTSQAAAIGSSVIIGRDCTLGNRCVIKDCVLVEDGTVIPSDMVVPPFAIVRGNPARILDADDDVLPESAAVAIPEERVEAFGLFVKSLGG